MVEKEIMNQEVKESEKDDTFYTCKYDRAFKEVFMNEKNKDILIELLQSVLKLKINKVEYKNLERNSDNVHVKRKHFDLNLETDIGKIEVEVNAADRDYVRPRNMAYLCDLYSHHEKVGDKYDEETLILQINFSYGINDSEYIRKYNISDKSGKQFVKNFIIYELNMDKYKEFWYTRSKKEIEDSKYLLMLDMEQEDLGELTDFLDKDKVVKKYMDELKRLNKDPEFREYMSAEEDNLKIENSLKSEFMKKGREDGIKIGLEQGSINKTIEIAKSMLKDNMSKEIISKYTNLSIEEIEKLKA